MQNTDDKHEKIHGTNDMKTLGERYGPSQFNLKFSKTVKIQIVAVQ